MTDRFNQPAQGTEDYHNPLNENFADLGIEVDHWVDQWSDLPSPSGETSTAGNPKRYVVRGDNLIVADDTDVWRIVAGLGSSSRRLPEIYTQTADAETFDADSANIRAQDLSVLSLGSADHGRIYRHDGSSTITTTSGDTSTPGYYAWDNGNSAWAAIVQF